MKWTREQTNLLIENYPIRGKQFCCELLGLSEGSVRQKAFTLKLRHDKFLPGFFKEWQQRAALSKVGKKRPEQAEVMRRLHRDGKLLKTAEQKVAQGIRLKKWVAEHGPFGPPPGKKITPEQRNKINAGIQRARGDLFSKWNSPERTQQRSDVRKRVAQMTPAESVYSKTKGGMREDLGLYFRSSWEANIARYFNLLVKHGKILKWEYEAERFDFLQIKRGCRSYCPDFRITRTDGGTYYVEVKGWMDAKSKTRLDRMKRYYPQVEIELIDEKRYKEIRKWAKIIPGWE